MTPQANCLTCSTGSHYWARNATFCPGCDGNPLVAGSGRPDYSDWQRAQFVRMFGPRKPGDEELLEKYRDELRRRGIA